MLLLCKIKRIVPILISVSLFATSAVSQTELGYLQKWVGKYPVSTRGQPHRNIYRTRPLRRRLVRLLGRKTYKRLLNDYYVMGPVAIMGDYIVVDRCERHNCDES